MKIQGNIGQLEIRILRRSNLETSDYWDANWLESEIRIEVSGFNGLYGANLRVEELQKFYKELISLQKSTENEAMLTTIEEGIYLHCKVEVNGAIECKGKASNATGNTLTFRIQTDLASLDSFINELHAVLELYPLIGDISLEGN